VGAKIQDLDRFSKALYDRLSSSALDSSADTHQDQPVPSTDARRRRATLRDVAAAAGVSSTTASFVLNDRADFKISAETRERVLAAAQTLEYRPHHMARGLSRGRSTLLGLIVPDLTNPYSWEVALALDRVGFDGGYSLVVFDAQRSQGNAHERIERMIGLSLDGVLLIHPSNVAEYLDTQTRRRVARTIPAVCYGSSPQPAAEAQLPGCYVDGVRTGYLATRHLIDRGHRRIAFLASQLPWALEWDREHVRSRPRYVGYCQALEEADLPADDGLFWAAPPGAQSEGLLRDRLQSAAPTGLVAYNDMAALDVYRAALSLGRRIPGDLAIVGVDDIALAGQLFPPLTTVSQGIAEGVELAARMLLRMIEDHSYAGEVVVLEPRLIVRGSA
jgi:DNA-binding LacI/PurR family transcriptional regulator